MRVARDLRQSVMGRWGAGVDVVVEWARVGGQRQPKHTMVGLGSCDRMQASLFMLQVGRSSPFTPAPPSSSPLWTPSSALLT